jgi:hypothetical protein
MTQVTEGSLGDLPWLVVRGDSAAGFRALGQHARARIHGVVRDLPRLAAVQRYAASPAGRARVQQATAVTEAQCPEEMAELRAMAEGAGLPFETLLLLNLKGDLGDLKEDLDDAGAGGCSDVAWRGEHSIMAHNEDNPPSVGPHCTLLTLLLDGQPPVTAFWYPGCLPCTAFSVTANGLVFSIDHLPVNDPVSAPGRHFIARQLQRCAGLDGAIDFLKTHPAAGGFAYTIGEIASGRIATVETAGGRFAVQEADDGRLLLWHTNHVRFMPPEDSSAVSNASRQRADVLAQLERPSEAPSVQWLLDILTEPPPDGVQQNGASATLCSFVADLSADHIVIMPRDGQVATARISGLLAVP